MKVSAPQQDTGLLVTLAALKSQVSTLSLRVRQAEEAAALLISEKLPEELRDQLFAKIVAHMEARGAERGAQFKAVIQTALISLNDCARTCADPVAKQGLVEVVKALTMTVEADNFTPERK